MTDRVTRSLDYKAVHVNFNESSLLELGRAGTLRGELENDSSVRGNILIYNEVGRDMRS